MGWRARQPGPDRRARQRLRGDLPAPPRSTREGRVHRGRHVNASCGTGCWGTFDETIAYDVARAGWGTLQVYVLSAKDGSVENLTEYPVWLTP